MRDVLTDERADLTLLSAGSTIAEHHLLKLFRVYKALQQRSMLIMSAVTLCIGFTTSLSFAQTPDGLDSDPLACDDGTQNGDESDVDCGGRCRPCGEGSACLVDTDCEIGRCVGAVCLAASCDDGVRNQDESDVDCGGALCPPCADGARCEVDRDCQFDQCLLSVCVAPSCDDGVQGIGESDVDCGGLVCTRCEVGERCGSHADCASRRCLSGIEGKRCVAPTCEDLTQNGGESDVDCGGDCEPCQDRYTCLVDEDCESMRCRDQRCAIPRCDDRRRNGEETDVDCGGLGCPPCTATLLCEIDADCESRLCLGQRCAAPTCSDLRLNQDEVDVDCGGVCPACEVDDGDMGTVIDMELSADMTVVADMSYNDQPDMMLPDMESSPDDSVELEPDMAEITDDHMDMQIVIFDQATSAEDMGISPLDQEVIELPDQGMMTDSSYDAEIDMSQSTATPPASQELDGGYDPSVFARERPRSGCDTRSEASDLGFLPFILIALAMSRRERRWA